MQQGNNNVMMETSQAAVQESFESEALDSEPESSTYDVVIQDAQDREFDHQTLDALGVVSRSDQRMPSADQGSDDETYEKQVVAAADLGTSPKTVYLPHESSFPPHMQPSALQFEHDHIPADVCSPSANEVDVTVNSSWHVARSEHWQTAGLGAEEHTARKGHDFDEALRPAASADSYDDNDCDAVGDGDGDDGQAPVSNDEQLLSAEVQADAAVALTVIQESESVCQVEAQTLRVTKDSCLLNSNSSCTFEAGELQSDTSMSPMLLSMQQESSVSGHVIDDNNSGHSTAQDQRAANYWSWLSGAIFRAAQVVMYINRYVTV